MSLKNTKTLRKCLKNLQSQMSELQFLKTPILSSALSKLQNGVNFSIFFLFKLPVFIINGSSIFFNKHGKTERLKH